MISIVDLKGEYFDKNLSLEICPSSRVAIIFPRDTAVREFIRLFLGMERPIEGYIEIDQKKVHEFSKEEIIEWRKNTGVLFRDGGLISNLKLWENITLPVMYHGLIPYDKIVEKGLEVLRRTGISKEPMSPVTGLNLFERRLVSMARLMLMNPRITIYENIFYGLSMDERLRLLELSNTVDGIRIYLLLSDEMLPFIKPEISLDIRGMDD